MQLEKLRQKMLEHENQTRNRANKDAKVTPSKTWPVVSVYPIIYSNIGLGNYHSRNC